LTHPEVLMRLPELGRSARLALLVLGLVGCGHSEPFGAEHFDTDQPFNPTPPIRLTLNPGPDRGAAWLSGGSAITYSTQLLDSRDHDVCLAVLAATGGRQTALTCQLVPTGGQQTEAIETAAPASDGRLAFVVASSGIGALVPLTQSIALGTISKPTEYRTLLSLPYNSTSGRFIGGLSQLHWLDQQRLLYLAEVVSTRLPCNGCPIDTVRSGQEAQVVSVDVPGSFAVVPGTDFASGVSPASTGDEVYYTLGGDSRVYRRVLSSGDVTVAYDFGATGIARDVHVIGSTLAAVVGGRVAFSTDPSLGPVQWDSGGTLHVVDLSNGSDITIDGPGLFRRPQLSPDATQVVAEVYPLIITPLLDGAADTTVGRNGDLYVVGRP
jgi:hypothetical protein